MAANSSTPSTNPNEVTSYTLIEKVRGSDEHGWERLSALYGPLVRRWAMRSGLQSDDAADVAQEVFRVVSQKIGTFDADRKPTGAFRSWLKGITQKKVADHYRSLKKQPVGEGGSSIQRQWQQLPDPIPFSLSDTDQSHDGASDDPESQRVFFLRCVELLKDDFEPKTWTAFWRLAVQGHSAQEIGDDLNMSEQAVRQAKYRILERLKKELAGDIPPLRQAALGDHDSMTSHGIDPLRDTRS